MATTLPTYADNLTHTTWDQALSAAVPMMLEGVVEFGKYAKPTTQLLWGNKQYIEVGPEKRFRINWSYGGSSVHYGTSGTMTFETDIVETMSSMHASPEVIYAATAISDFDRKIYSNSMLDLVDDRTFKLNQGLTDAINYEVWAKQGSAAESATSGGASEIVIDEIFTHGMNEVRIKGTPASAANRIKSIPSLLKPVVNGHTLQNIAVTTTTNKFWHPHVYIAKGITTGGEPAKISSLGTTTLNFTSAATGMAADGSDWVDSNDNVVSDTGAANGSNSYSVFPALSDIDFMLEKMQEGNSYQIIVACSPAAYNYLARDFFGATLGKDQSSGLARAMDSQNPLTDYGLNFTGQAFAHSGYDAIFYADPTLATAWPGSMFFFDLDAIKTTCVNDFGPKIYPWHHLPNSTVDVMAKVLWMQNVVLDRQATGWLMGCKWR